MLASSDPMDVDLAAARREIAEETKDLPKRMDATGRVVPEKTANRPFFVYQDYKKKLDEASAAKLERQRIRAEKIAAGDTTLGPDPDAERKPVPIGAFLRVFVIMLLMGMYAGYFVAGDPLWGYETKWLTVRHWASYLPDGTQRAYTERQLARYDGSDPEKPLLLGLDGIVYDVSEGRRVYGPGGGYHQFAGRDAVRAYVTGCFKEHLTHDLRGLNADETKALEKWRKFYAEHKTYKKVGTVYHPPIHPSTPIPAPCNPDGASEQKEAVPGPQLPPAAPEKPRPKAKQEL